MRLRMLKLEMCPAGASGTKVSALGSFGLALNPSKAEKQYDRFALGSADEEQALVLLEVCCSSVPIGVGGGGGGGGGGVPFVPPVRVDPEGVAVKDAVGKELLWVTAAESG